MVKKFGGKAAIVKSVDDALNVCNE